MTQYRLFYKETCPFCKKVRSFIEKNHIEAIEEVEIKADPADEDYLIEKGGQDMVPCLFIDDQAMYESEDIIQYLRDHFLDGQGEGADDLGGNTCPL